MTLATRRVAFVAPYSLVDPASGAAIATWRGLQLLATAGFSCQAFCAARLDAGEEVCFEETLAQLGLPYDVRATVTPGGPAKLVFAKLGDLPITVFRNQWTQTGPTPHEAPAFLAAYEQFLVRSQPGVIIPGTAYTIIRNCPDCVCCPPNLSLRLFQTAVPCSRGKRRRRLKPRCDLFGAQNEEGGEDQCRFDPQKNSKNRRRAASFTTRASLSTM